MHSRPWSASLAPQLAALPLGEDGLCYSAQADAGSALYASMLLSSLSCWLPLCISRNSFPSCI